MALPRDLAATEVWEVDRVHRAARAESAGAAVPAESAARVRPARQVRVRVTRVMALPVHRDPQAALEGQVDRAVPAATAAAVGQVSLRERAVPAVSAEPVAQQGLPDRVVRAVMVRMSAVPAEMAARAEPVAPEETRACLASKVAEAHPALAESSVR
jgi:hypothetical protein